MESVTAYLATLIRETRKPEGRGARDGLSNWAGQLWRERVLGRYPRDEMGHDEAVEAVGIDWVELAERRHAAMREDLAWAPGE